MKLKQKNKTIKNSKGITLIALVVTIIVLIILAGISINLVLGENGIIQKSKNAKELSEEQMAKEKLEIELYSLSINKETGSEYNDEIFDSYLTNKKFIVNGDIVLSNGWQFKVDKRVPKIVASLGKGEEVKNIEVVTNVEYSMDFSKANLKIEIMYEGNIVQIKLNEEEIEIPQKIDGVYKIEQEILTNGNYSIYVKDEKDGYKLTNASITEISEDISIETTEQLRTLAERVNKGATYEGKTITLSKDVNFNENKYTINEDGTITFHSDAEQWIPIGTVDNPFKGTFDGQGHTIKGIYINDETKNTQGFIGQNTGGTVKNLTLDEGYIVAGYRIGGATGRSYYGTIDNVINKMNIESKAIGDSAQSLSGGISGSGVATSITNCINYGNIIANKHDVGGIIGYIEDSPAKIENCANLSEYVKTTGASNTGYSYIGGIVGWAKQSNIIKCYNTAEITGGKSNVGGIAGNSAGTIIQCYNTGDIQSLGVNNSGNNTIGGIVGYSGNTVSDCYNTGTVTGTEKMIGGIVGSNGETSETVKQELKNCYSIGEIKPTTAKYRGGVAGSGKNISNSYYLTGQASYGIGGSSSSGGSNTNATPKTKAQLQALVSTLGTDWISDGKIQNENGEWVDNKDSQGNIIYINGGYPILKWQMER